MTIDRRTLLRGSAAMAAAGALIGPFGARSAAAQAARLPVCTVEPNVGEGAVPGPRVGRLAGIAGSKQTIPTRIAFVDIAELVKGASKGEGLGNQFLA
ncbi:hypothetical protein IC63_06355, partial [Paracoccus sphaerophysae]